MGFGLLAGATALMVAAAKGNLELASLLVSHGADPHVKATDDSSAADWASRFGHTEIAKVLADHVAVSLPVFRLGCSNIQCSTDLSVLPATK